VTDDTSLVLTVLNESKTITSWLDSLECSSVLPSEIVICDGGSTDGTTEIIASWATRSQVPVQVVQSPGSNISEGRNIAISHARGPWIAITDAGTTLDRNWLEELTAARADASVVSGFFRPTGGTGFEKILATAITPRLDEINPENFLPSSRSLLILKSAWETVSGYPEWLDYCEDLVFDLELKGAGFTFSFAPRAIVSWSARSTVRAFAKQYYRYARGDGKANLWTKRHALRYAVYLSGVLLLVTAVTGHAWVFIPLLAGMLGYNFRYFRRVASSQSLSAKEKLAGLAMVLVIGTVGDVAKMAGYPAGLFWRTSWRRNFG